MADRKDPQAAEPGEPPADGGKPRMTAVEQVVREIREAVRVGRLVPGQRLVEADLTQELGVSRGPLREALSRLAAEGLVEIEPYKGATVRRMTREDVIDLFRVREALEGQAARLAAEKIDDGENRKRMTEARHEIEIAGALEDPWQYMEENISFHDLIIELSGNQLLASLSEQLQTNAFRLRHHAWVRGASRDASVGGHKAVADAILAGEPDEAESAMRAHVGDALAELLARPGVG